MEFRGCDAEQANPLNHKGKCSARDLQSAIRDILNTRASAAQRSEYDRSVCVRAVGVARETIEGVPLSVDAASYGVAVMAALNPLCEDYSDPEGEYTSGKSSIGDVYADIYQLLATMR